VTLLEGHKSALGELGFALGICEQLLGFHSATPAGQVAEAIR